MYSCKQGFSRACPKALSRLDQWRWMLCMAQAARRASRSRAGPQRERERDAPDFFAKNFGVPRRYPGFFGFWRSFHLPPLFFSLCEFFHDSEFPRDSPLFTQSFSRSRWKSRAFTQSFSRSRGKSRFSTQSFGRFLGTLAFFPGHLQGTFRATLNYFEHLACT